MPAPPSPAAFEDFRRELAGLHLALAPANLVLVSSIDSTNLLARRVLAEYDEEEETSPDFLVVAFEQTAGRGRGTRSWVSAPGLGIYATRVFRLAELDRLQTLPLLVAVALARSLNRWLDGRCRLKWPNDLLVGGRKIGGVLLETVLSVERGASVIAGFGVNYGHSPAALPAPTATSLRTECGDGLPALSAVAAALVRDLEESLARPPAAAAVVEAFRDLTIHRTGEAMRCEVAGEIRSGTFLGLDENGFLRLETDSGEMLLTAGEVLDR